jgi:hypothetical protein
VAPTNDFLISPILISAPLKAGDRTLTTGKEAGMCTCSTRLSDKVTLAAEYTAMQNYIHMAGGMDDAEYNANPRASYRSRNWLASPWNVAAIVSMQRSMIIYPSPGRTPIYTAARNLVWLNEDVGAGVPDTISQQTNSYASREVERERFDNYTSEARMSASLLIWARRKTPLPVVCDSTMPIWNDRRMVWVPQAATST